MEASIILLYMRGARKPNHVITSTNGVAFMIIAAVLYTYTYPGPIYMAPARHVHRAGMAWGSIPDMAYGHGNIALY